MEKRKSYTHRDGSTGYAETRNLLPFGGPKSTAHVRTANFIPQAPSRFRPGTDGNEGLKGKSVVRADRGCAEVLRR